MASPQPRDLSPDAIRTAQSFFDVYNDPPDDVKKTQWRVDVADKLGIPAKETFRWVYVVEPLLRKTGETWPYYDDVEAASARLRARYGEPAPPPAPPGSGSTGALPSDPPSGLDAPSNVTRNNNGWQIRIQRGEDRICEYFSALEYDGWAEALEAASDRRDAILDQLDEGAQPGDISDSVVRSQNAPAEEETKEFEGDWAFKKDYLYLPSQRVYLFEIPELDDPYVISFDELKDIVVRYSNFDGDAHQINQICYEVGLDREVFMGIKKAIGLTHTSAPRLAEEFEEMEDEDAVIRAAKSDLALKRQRYKREFQNRDYRKMKKQAEKWRNFEFEYDKRAKEQIQRMQEFVQTYSVPKAKLKTATRETDGLLVCNAQDLHFGLRPHQGFTNLEAYKLDLLESAEEAYRDATALSKLDHIMIVIGGDLCHVDNYQGETTKGTPQDLIASPDEVEEACEEYMTEKIDLARQYAPVVELIPCWGNHDRQMSQSVYRWLASYFRHAGDVIAPTSYSGVAYRKWNDHSIITLHNDLSKKQFKKLPQIAIKEERELMATTSFTTVYTGHSHGDWSWFDEAGWKYFRAPAPNDDDRYHNEQLYVGRRKTLQNVLHLEGHAGDRVFNPTVRRTHREGALDAMRTYLDKAALSISST